MDLRAYLDRIGYRGPLTPTAETLRALDERGEQPEGLRATLESEEERAALLRELFGVVV